MKTKLYLIFFGLILTSHAYSFSLKQDDSIFTDSSFKDVKKDLRIINFEIIDEPYIGEKMIIKKIVDPRKNQNRELWVLYSW
jgi:hypothetical protein